MIVRPLGPDDFLPAWESVDAWFGEAIHEPVHPVFFHHFGGYAVEDEDQLIGFLIGFRSQADRDVAYIHVVAVHPERRGEGIAADLYARFERQAKSWGCTTLQAVTDPANEVALRFHEGQGFWKELVPDWGGRGEDRYVLRKRIEPAH